VGGNGHNGTGAVGDEHIVADPDWNACAIDGIDGIGAGENAGFVLGEVGPLEVALGGGFIDIRVDSCKAIGGCNARNERVLGREDHVGCAEKRVWTGCIDFESRIMPIDLKDHRGTFGLADPVALHELDRLRPVELVEIFEETICIGSDFQNPLANSLADDFCAAAVAVAVFNLFVCKACFAGRAPVDGHFSFVGKAFLEKLEEDPLGPFIVFGIAGGYFARPVVRKAKRFYLRAEAIDIRIGSYSGVRACLNRVILGGEPEGIETHWMEDIVAVHTQVAAVDVGCGIALWVANMQTRSRWIGKHIEHIPALFFWIALIFDRAEGLVFFPALLPLLFDFLERILRHGFSPDAMAESIYCYGYYPSGRRMASAAPARTRPMRSNHSGFFRVVRISGGMGADGLLSIGIPF